MQGLGFVRNRGEARGLNCLEMRGTEVGKGGSSWRLWIASGQLYSTLVLVSICPKAARAARMWWGHRTQCSDVIREAQCV